VIKNKNTKVSDIRKYIKQYFYHSLRYQCLIIGHIKDWKNRQYNMINMILLGHYPVMNSLTMNCMVKIFCFVVIEQNNRI